MSDPDITALCAALPGASCSQPFGPEADVWKLAGKIFAIVSTMGGGVSVKCRDAETAHLLIEMGRATPAPYLPRGGWVRIMPGTMPPDELAERIATSYAVIRASLPKRLRDQTLA